jgi:hypothetical protein
MLNDVMPLDPKSIGTLRISRILTQDELLLATSLWPLQLQNEYPGSRKLKELNEFQKEALDIAYGSSFTLIQGPPGIPVQMHAPYEANSIIPLLPINYRYW